MDEKTYDEMIKRLESLSKEKLCLFCIGIFNVLNDDKDIQIKLFNSMYQEIIKIDDKMIMDYN